MDTLQILNSEFITQGVFIHNDLSKKAAALNKMLKNVGKNKKGKEKRQG